MEEFYTLLLDLACHNLGAELHHTAMGRAQSCGQGVQKLPGFSAQPALAVHFCEAIKPRRGADDDTCWTGHRRNQFSGVESVQGV